MENINRFVDEGKSLMEQGKDQDASEAFAKAIDILNMALDADIFNKAD
jgi:flagellin-specific chaperone FliS